MSSSFKPTRISPSTKFEGQAAETLAKPNLQVPAEALPKPYLTQNHNIKTIEVDTSYNVGAFESQKLTEPKDPHSYAQWRKHVGQGQVGKDTRFHLHELAKANLSVEAEEEQRIEDEVARRVSLHLTDLAEVTRKNAYDEGYGKGLERARQEVISSMQADCDHLRGLVKAIDDAANLVAIENEEVLLRIMEQLIRKIFLKEVSLDREWIVRVMHQAIGMLSTRANIKLKVSRADIGRSETIMADLNRSLTDLKNVSIEADDTLSLGGCRVETDFGTLDASIERIFVNLHAALEGGISGEPK